MNGAPAKHLLNEYGEDTIAFSKLVKSVCASMTPYVVASIVGLPRRMRKFGIQLCVTLSLLCSTLRDCDAAGVVINGSFSVGFTTSQVAYLHSQVGG